MQEYPTIEAKIKNVPVYVFPKYDGSNIRAEWTKKRGFHKFGSRHQLLDETNNILGPAIPLIKNSFGESLDEIFRKNKWEQATCFFEFFGPSSFAGYHDENEEKKVVLIDVHQYKNGIIDPRDFIKMFSEHPTLENVARPIHYGNITEEIYKQIKEGTFPDMEPEGVVCKAIQQRRFHGPTMFKIKSDLWFKRLRERCGKDEALFEKLK